MEWFAASKLVLDYNGKELGQIYSPPVFCAMDSSFTQWAHLCQKSFSSHSKVYSHSIQ